MDAGTGGLVQLLTAGVRISREALVTNATVGRCIFAVAVGSASWITSWRTDWWHAEKLWVADESLSADAGLGVGVAVSVQAAVLASARVDTSSRLANLVSSRTRTSH